MVSVCFREGSCRTHTEAHCHCTASYCMQILLCCAHVQSSIIRLIFEVEVGHAVKVSVSDLHCQFD